MKKILFDKELKRRLYIEINAKTLVITQKKQIHPRHHPEKLF